MQHAIDRIARILAHDQIAYDEFQGLLADATALPPSVLDTLITRADAVHRLLIGARLRQELHGLRPAPEAGAQPSEPEGA